MSRSRERILARLRRANAATAPCAHPGVLAAPVPPSAGAAAGKVIETFAQSLRQAGGEVIGLSDDEQAADWLADWAASFPSVAIGAGVPEPLRPDRPAALPHQAALAVSRARGGAADTGSLALDSREGRRVQLLAPVHLVWVYVDEILPTLAHLLDRLHHDLPAAVGLHSGPSKSADIGQIMVQGVHGPGRLVAAVIERR